MRLTRKRDCYGHANAGFLPPLMTSSEPSFSRRNFLSGGTCFGIFAGLIALSPQASEAQSVFRRRADLNSLRRSQYRDLYRPRIQIVRPSGGSKSFRVGQALPYSFYAKRGFVTRIEVRSGLKVVKSINLGQARSGRGSITITNRDLAAAGKAGKKIGFTIWAWQGQPSYQSVHGESIRYQLLP